MTGAIIGTGGGSKRSLPTWMWSKDTTKNGTSENLDEIRPTSGKLTEIQDAVSNIGSVSREADVLVPEKTKDSEHKESFLHNDSRKKAGKSISSGFNETASGFGKRKLKEQVIGCEQSLSEQRMAFKRAKSNSVKDLSQGMTGDEIELTIEDLISIAEECVSANKEIPHEQHVIRKSGLTSESLSSSVSSIPEGGKLNSSIRSGRVFSKCTETSTPLLRKPNKKQEEFATFPYSRNSHAGDSAQDMLELLLGPLLKKAPPKEPDPTKELLTSASESDELVRSSADVEKQAPLKKKGSLIEKVAMLF